MLTGQAKAVNEMLVFGLYRHDILLFGFEKFIHL